MEPLKNEGEAYRKITAVLKRRRKPATIADITAATALPLSLVRELLPRAADEFSGRLEVTESGEIRYSFPRGFTSRYRGFKAGLKRFGNNFFTFMGAAGSLLFKVWIMVMLIGYFVLFLAIAIGGLFLSVAAQSKNSNGRRQSTVYAGSGIFNMIWRLWFYSELTRSYQRYDGRVSRADKAPSRPMHKAIFSFVFGEADPNRNLAESEHKALIAYIQAHRGVISLPEFMAFTGKNSAEAEEAIIAFCAEFGGSPEATDEGTIVYRFDELLLRDDTQRFAELSPSIQRLRQFSANPKSMNIWFIIINAVNLFFGSYFLYHSFTTGLLYTVEQFQAASFLYGFTYSLFMNFQSNPLPFISIVLGVIPLVFSLLFWLVPALRSHAEKKENDNIRLRNFKRLGFSRIWSRPLQLASGDIEASAEECRPHNLNAAREQVIKEMGAWSVPEVEINSQGATVYSFTELEREKQALEKYRAGVDPARTDLGKTVFDSGA
ncbi:hypothetical protein AGMMS50293_14210 [Spirochaetia bacterium]|nr:hypothetical protein AGMMS50293_14210 [Spirochaetia bacterium]